VLLGKLGVGSEPTKGMPRLLGTASPGGHGGDFTVDPVKHDASWHEIESSMRKPSGMMEESKRCTPAGKRMKWRFVPTLLRSIARVAGPFFLGKERRRRAWLLSLSILALLLYDNFSLVWFSYALRKNTTALAMKDEKGFYDSIQKFLLIISLAIPVITSMEWLKGCLAIEWRRHVTKVLLKGYLIESRAYYSLKHDNSDIDNPDQRICQDVGEFTDGTIGIVLAIIHSVLTLISGSGVLISICPELFAVLLSYAVVGTVVMLCIFGLPLMRIQRRVLEQEANLRFSLVRVRENAEAIAFYQGASFEDARCRGFFSTVQKTLYRRLAIMTGCHGFKRVYTWLTFILPGLMVGPKYMRGEIDFGAITQAGAIFMTLLEAMMVLTSNLDHIAHLGAQATRINRLSEAVEDMSFASKAKGVGTSSDEIILEEFVSETKPEPDAASPRSASISTMGSESHCNEAINDCEVLLRLDRVTMRPPQLPPKSDQETAPVANLVTDLSLELRAGESLLICGGSGIGKSSLLRAIGGLWSAGCGRVARCSSEACCFLPQQPYMCLGTLREQATYPCSPADEKQILGALADVNLGYLVERHGLDTVADFSRVLSLGEQQRLGFARLLLRPGVRLALLDEGTSALDEQNEARLYGLLRARVPCYVSVGHRPMLHRFHSQALRLEPLPHGGCSGRLVPTGFSTETVVSI